MLLLSSILIVLGATLLFANKGIWRHIQLRHETGNDAEKLAQLETEERFLQQQVDLLRKEDRDMIERVARERYQMHRPGEIVYREERK